MQISESESKFKMVEAYVQEHFFAEYLDGLKEFVRIPSLTPCFDPKW
jgi:hypothetical protein